MHPRFSIAALALASVVLIAGNVSAGAASHAPVKANTPWWKHAVFYEIYPRSFADSNNDGIGDINGITAKLDYLADLGVDALWLTPCFPSPQVDFGYDISNYEDIAPEYGTLADFDRLVAEAKKRNIKIIMDLVLNHTSDKHPWFIESRSSKDNPKRDWFVWRDAKIINKNGKPTSKTPNNWYALFGTPAWTLDDRTGQYYYHFFYPEQPDLNWENPKVRTAMYDVAKFWMDRGVAGFRLDAVSTLFEDKALPDNPIVKGKDKFGRPNMVNKYNHQLPRVHEVLKELRAEAEKHPQKAVLIGETSTNSVEGLTKMYGTNHDELQLPMNFFFAYINKLSAPEFRKQIGLWDSNSAGGWPVYLFSNHDQTRHYVRYGDGKNNDAATKLLATMILTLRGTPILYYGEEIGMENNDPTRKEDVQDPIGKLGWPEEKGRDGERTPMQWTAGTNAGFSDAKPWYPVAKNYTTHNVAAESADPNSILNLYKALTALRRNNDALKYGTYEALNKGDKNVFCYARKTANKMVMVALNMSAEPQTLSIKLPAGKSKAAGTVPVSSATVLVSSVSELPAKSGIDFTNFKLPAYGAVVLEPI